MPGYLGTSTRSDEVEQAGGGAEAERRDLVTSVMGNIVSYDAASQTATVRPAYSQKIGGRDFPAPELLKVPIHHPRGGGYADHFPVKVGNAVRLTAMMRPLDPWQADGSAHDGAPGRMHDWSSMVAVPAGEPDTKPLPASVTGGYWRGSEDGKRGLSVDDTGKAAIRGGPSGSDKFVVTPAGKVDLKGENGDGVMQIIRDFLTAYKGHKNATWPMDAPDIAAADALIARIDAIKS